MKHSDHKELLAGFSLCTHGQREILVNGRLYAIVPGVMWLNSPVLSVVELSRSADYAEMSIMEEIKVLYGAIRQRFSTIYSMRLWNSPCLALPADYVDLFKARKLMIDDRRRRLEETAAGEEYELMQQMLHLIEQETMLEFMLLYYRNCAVEPRSLEKGESVAYQFVYAVTQRFHTLRRVGDYAAMFGLSASRLNHLVKSATGRSPLAWIITITTVCAQDLLRDTDKSIKEIAAELNFPEQFTFRKFFKQHTGVSPTAYRNSRSGGSR